MNGALLADKPSGPTSHDIVAFVRRTLKTPRVGHTGTLDPLATGLLVLLVGHATRLAQFVSVDEKEYIADVRLGVATATYDAQELAPKADNRWSMTDAPSAEAIEQVLEIFRGTFQQQPPPFSAKKVGGVPAYKKARRAEATELRPVEVTVRELVRISDIGPRPSDFDAATLIRLRVAASAGFYVRSLAHDLGQALGCGAHLEALRRTRAGRFSVDDAVTLDAVEAKGADALISPNALLAGMPGVRLTEAGTIRAGHGTPLRPHDAVDAPVATGGGRMRLLDPTGSLVGVAEARPDGLLHPLVVLR